HYDEFERGYKAWQASNDFVRERLASHVDVVFPSLYQFYEELASWEIYARDNIEEAAKFHKAIYPFLWFRYHPDGKAQLAGYIPAASWRRQLELVSELSDGAVLWGGVQEPWDGLQPWWRTTVEFLRDRRVSPSPLSPSPLSPSPSGRGPG